MIGWARESWWAWPTIVWFAMMLTNLAVTPKGKRRRQALYYVLLYFGMALPLLWWLR